MQLQEATVLNHLIAELEEIGNNFSMKLKTLRATVTQLVSKTENTIAASDSSIPSYVELVYSSKDALVRKDVVDCSIQVTQNDIETASSYPLESRMEKSLIWPAPTVINLSEISRSFPPKEKETAIATCSRTNLSMSTPPEITSGKNEATEKEEHLGSTIIEEHEVNKAEGKLENQQTNTSQHPGNDCPKQVAIIEVSPSPSQTMPAHFLPQIMLIRSLAGPQAASHTRKAPRLPSGLGNPSPSLPKKKPRYKDRIEAIKRSLLQDSLSPDHQNLPAPDGPSHSDVPTLPSGLNNPGPSPPKEKAPCESKMEALQRSLPQDHEYTSQLASDASTHERAASTSGNGEDIGIPSSEEVPTPQSQGDELYQCPECPKVYTRKRSLYKHVRVHVNPTEAKCKVCGKSLCSLDTLKLHMFRHTGVKPFACDQCSASFVTRKQLRQHRFRHTNFRPFKCSYCPDAFYLKQSWQKHLMRHRGERPFQCEQCGKSFTQIGSLNSHIARHRNEKHFKCPMCDKAFNTNEDLYKHKKLHTGLREHACNQCTKRFARSSGLSKHMKTHRKQ